MIGKKHISIDGNEFVRGISTSDQLSDGGFSPDTDAVNITYTPGVLYAPANVTDKSTNLTENIIASCEDPGYVTGIEQVYLDDAGAFYTWDGTTLTKQVTASGDLFTEGTTNFIPWYDASNNIKFYATTKAGSGGDIVRWDKSTTLVENWWTSASHRNQAALSAFTPWRPLLVYETFLFVGDANKLHRVSADNPMVVSNGILTLGYLENISALGVDKGSGLMMVCTTQGADYSASKNGKSKIYLYDGLSPKASRVIPVNGVITSIKNIDDRTIVFMGNKIGYFTGSGVKFLRKMNFALGDATKLVYPHRSAVIENTVYFLENTKVMAYGEVREKGEKVFYPVLSNNVNPNTYKCISSIGGGKLGLGFASSKFYTFDTTSIATSSGITFISNKINFPRKAVISHAYIEYTDALVTNDNNRALYYRTQTDPTGWTLLNVQGGTSIKNSSASSVYFIDDIIGFTGETRFVQFRYIASTANAGVKRIVIYYDDFE